MLSERRSPVNVARRTDDAGVLREAESEIGVPVDEPACAVA
jgi:hypothetical protein